MDCSTKEDMEYTCTLRECKDPVWLATEELTVTDLAAPKHKLSIIR